MEVTNLRIEELRFSDGTGYWKVIMEVDGEPLTRICLSPAEADKVQSAVLKGNFTHGNHQTNRNTTGADKA